MKILGGVVSALILPLVLSCSTVKNPESAKVVRDCTGTYLQIDKKDYLVCNVDILKNFKEGETVSATFEKTDYCPEFEGQVVCMMYHQNEGKIRVKTVK